MDVSATNERLTVVWPHLHGACTETAISELPVDILITPLIGFGNPDFL